jgi:hypothetical protein
MQQPVILLHGGSSSHTILGVDVDVDVVGVVVVGKIHTLFTHVDTPRQSDELQHGKPGADSTQNGKLQSPETQSEPPLH